MDDCCGRVAMLAIVKGGIDAVGRTGGICRTAIDRGAVAGQYVSRPLFGKGSSYF